MEDKFYIQRDGQQAQDIWGFFKLYAGRGFSETEPTSPNEGEIYVDPIIGSYYTFTGEVWVESSIPEDQYIYCGIPSSVGGINYSEGTYKYSDKSIYLDYNYKGISVTSTEDINKFPDRKQPYTEDWKDQQGLDSYITENTYYKSKDVKVAFLIQGETSEEVKIKLESFLTYISAKGYVNYFDTYRGNGFRGYYVSHDVKEEKFNSFNYQHFEITFTVDRLCFGYSATKCPLIGITVNDGFDGAKYEVYASNGDIGLFVDDGVFGGDFNFIIVVPDYAGMLSLSCVTPNVIGFNYDGDDYVIGMNYEDGNLVIGL